MIRGALKLQLELTTFKKSKLLFCNDLGQEVPNMEYKLSKTTWDSSCSEVKVTAHWGKKSSQNSLKTGILVLLKREKCFLKKNKKLKLQLSIDDPSCPNSAEEFHKCFKYINFTITIIQIRFGPRGHITVKLVITTPDIIGAEVQDILRMCGANCSYNCLISQLHLSRASRLQITHFDEKK